MPLRLHPRVSHSQLSRSAFQPLGEFPHSACGSCGSVVFRGWLCFPASCQSCRFVSARLDEPCSRGRRFRGVPCSGRRLVFSVWVLLTRVWAACASGKVCPLCCGPPRTHQAPRVTGRPPAPWSSAPCELWGLRSLTPWQGGGATPLPRSATPQATAARSSRPRSVSAQTAVPSHLRRPSGSVAPACAPRRPVVTVWPCRAMPARAGPPLRLTASAGSCPLSGLWDSDNFTQEECLVLGRSDKVLAPYAAGNV